MAWKIEGNAWKILGMRQAQVLLMRKLPKVIQAATMDPVEYWVSDMAVAVARWFG